MRLTRRVACGIRELPTGCDGNEGPSPFPRAHTRGRRPRQPHHPESGPLSIARLGFGRGGVPRPPQEGSPAPWLHGRSGGVGTRDHIGRVSGARGRRELSRLRDMGPDLRAVRVAADVRGNAPVTDEEIGGWSELRGKNPDSERWDEIRRIFKRIPPEDRRGSAGGLPKGISSARRPRVSAASTLRGSVRKRRSARRSFWNRSSSMGRTFIRPTPSSSAWIWRRNDCRG